MPIIVKDFTWHQTETFIIIHVPLRGIHQSKVHLFTTSELIKATYERFHFEIFLRHPIIVNESKCTLTETDIVFELNKKEIIQWDSLESNLTKAERNQLRKQLIDDEFSRQKEEKEKSLIKKHEMKRLAVTEAIKVDSLQREKIECLKAEEKNYALGDYAWRNHSYENSKLSITELESSSDEEEDPEVKPLPKLSIISQQMQKKNLNPPTSKLSIPPIRQKQILEVEFTERILPTPSRESKLAEENEYLEKQAIARRSAGFVSEDLRPEEKNPQYLLAKGDEFLANKNYLGAISAYSFGIKISDKFVDFYIQRAQAHVAIENYRKALDDCSTAIELMKPEVDANRHYRAVSMATRAFALNKIGLKRQAIEEMSYALRLEPKNEMFLRRMQMLQVDEMNTVSDDSD